MRIFKSMTCAASLKIVCIFLRSYVFQLYRIVSCFSGATKKMFLSQIETWLQGEIIRLKKVSLCEHEGGVLHYMST